MIHNTKQMVMLGLAASLLMGAVPVFGADANSADADAAIRKKLNKEIGRLSFADIDLKEVIAFLREYSGANIQVNWKALTMAGIEKSTKVSVDVRKVTVKRVLELVLRDASSYAAGVAPELCYMIDGGVLTISTMADLAKKPIRRTYDVRDLLVQNGSAASLRQRAKILVPMIRRLIDGESWVVPKGEPLGLIHLRAGRLVVTQTGPNHQALAKLIEQLRQVQATAQSRQTSIKSKPDPDAALREKLERNMARLSFADIDFKDVITYLQEYSKANIHVYWRALIAAGVEPTTKVSVDVRKVTVKRALELVLRYVSGVAAGSDAELCYMIDGGILTISTRSDLIQMPVRRVYDVRDLLMQDGSGVTQRERDLARDKLAENLMDLIRHFIAPESWADLQSGASARTPGVIQYFGGSLVVAQTGPNHQALAKLIEELREVQKTPKTQQASLKGESAADAALRKRLITRKIDRLSFADIDFKDVITFLQEYSDLSVHVNWRALTAAGIEQTTKVSVNVRKVTVKQALDLVLRDVSGAAAGVDAELRYMSDGGVLTISTKSDLARYSVRRAYDIRDLLMRDGSGVTKRERDRARDATAENLIRLIHYSIDPESWADPQFGVEPGAPGFIQMFGGSLVVAQTKLNHKAIAEFLRKLRDARAAQDRKVEPDAEVALRKNFDKSIERLKFNDICLSDVIQFFQEYSEINIHVNWRALINAGIEQTTKISMDKRKITVQQALDAVLRQINGKSPWTNLDYVIDRDVLIISTGLDLSREPIYRIYNVRDLLVQGGSGAARREMETASRKLTENLIALIRSSIDRASWAGPLGIVGPDTPGFIQVFDGLLVVTQTPQNHRALAEILRKLRKAKAGERPQKSQAVKQEDVGFADVPQELDLPRVGELVKFEKTLIRPADRLTIRADYTWKGAAK